MQPRDSHYRRERAQQEDTEQRELFLLRSVDLQQRRHGQREDEDIGEDVEARREVEEDRCVDTGALDALGRDGPELVERSALRQGHGEADNEEADMKYHSCFADDARHIAGHCRRVVSLEMG